jgi:hypothetical protein
MAGIRAELKAWDESEHPREPAGSSEGGQFAGGGGGSGGAEGGSQSTNGGKVEFTKDEKTAIGTYISDSTDINNYYRNKGEGNKEYDAAISSLNNAIKKGTISTEGAVWRGISECKIARDLRKDHNAEKMIGNNVPLGGFQSTTTDENVAYEFVAGYDSQIVLEITLPKGSHALDMVPFAQNFAKQKEVLLREGNFKITGVERPRRGPLYVKGTYVESA